MRVDGVRDGGADVLAMRRVQFDSLVQTASGFNVAEGEAYAAFVGDGSKPTPRPLPMQALDHAAGYLLAFGINAALCRTITVRIEHAPPV